MRSRLGRCFARCARAARRRAARAHRPAALPVAALIIAPTTDQVIRPPCARAASDYPRDRSAIVAATSRRGTGPAPGPRGGAPTSPRLPREERSARRTAAVRRRGDIVAFSDAPSAVGVGRRSCGWSPLRQIRSFGYAPRRAVALRAGRGPAWPARHQGASMRYELALPGAVRASIRGSAPSRSRPAPRLHLRDAARPAGLLHRRRPDHGPDLSFLHLSNARRAPS